VATNTYLAFTDGTTTCTFHDGANGATNYRVDDGGWAIGVANARRAQLGGRGPYDDVAEEMTLTVVGSTAQVAIDNLETLNNLMDQAGRWSRGENVSAVLVKYSPYGSTTSSAASPLQAAVLEGVVAPGAKFPTAGIFKGTAGYQIAGVRLRFRRRGLWLSSAEDSNTPSASSNGELITFTMAASVATRSPTRLSLTNFGYGRTPTSWFHGGFILLGEPVGGSVPIIILDAEGGTGTAYTAVADNGAVARGASVLRYTPTGTTEVSSGPIFSTSASLPGSTRLASIFANVRPSATVAFTLRVAHNTPSFLAYTRQVAIPANAVQYPQWVFCGTLQISTTDQATFYLQITADAASSFLDIDTLVIADADAVQVIGQPGPGDNDGYTSVVQSATLAHHHNLLTEISPEFNWAPSSNPDVDIRYDGDAVLVTRSATLYGLLLGTGGGSAGSAGNEFRQSNLISDVVLSNTWTAARRTAYRIPE
jgi:hypothetical protein